LLGEADRLADSMSLPGPRQVVLGVPTGYVPHAKPDAILARLGLDGPGIADATRRALARRRRVERAQEAERLGQQDMAGQRHQPGQNS
jgi:hypothetical protein